MLKLCSVVSIHYTFKQDFQVKQHHFDSTESKLHYLILIRRLQ